ncbi:MAG: hypothetical protein ACRBN8_24185 [Nannocystales bacterium]
MELPCPPDENLPHRAVGLHCKVFEAWPDRVWDNEHQGWLDKEDPLTSVRQYEDRVRGWFLRWGEHLRKHHDAGFVVLMVAVGYLEGNQQFRNGQSSKNNSTAFVVQALRRIFPWVLEAEAKAFYGRVRCGLFHDGMTKHGVEIENRHEQALTFDDDHFVVSPNKFLDLVVDDFDAYVVELQTPNSPALDSFLVRWEG